MYLVSVIIPVYNSEKLLKRCLESVKNQTWNSIEIIIVDNGSKDNSIKIIKEYVEKYSNFTWHVCEKKGASEARNLGIDKANGDYIVFVDSDDYVSENYIEKMINKVINDKYSMVLCNNTEIWKEKVEDRVLFKGIDSDINKVDVIREIASGNAGLVCSKMVNLKIIKEKNIRFATNISISEDLIFFLNVAEYTEEFIFLNESLYFYDRRNENSTTRNYIKNAWINQMYILNRIKQVFDNLELHSVEDSQIINNKFKKSIIFTIKNEIDFITIKNINTMFSNIYDILNKVNKNKECKLFKCEGILERLIIKTINSNFKIIRIIELIILLRVIYPLKNKIIDFIRR